MRTSRWGPRRSPPGSWSPCRFPCLPFRPSGSGWRGRWRGGRGGGRGPRLAPPGASPPTPPAMALVPFGFGLALDLQHGLGGEGLAVLAAEGDEGAVLLQAEVGRVDEEALGAAFQFEVEAAHGSIWSSGEGRAQLAFDRVDVADQIEVDLGVVQGGDHVGQLAFGGGAPNARPFQ